MRRLFLLLAVTALLVASAFASGSALAQGESCEGFVTAFEAQTTETLPEEAVGPGPAPPEGPAPFPGQGDEVSEVDQDLFARHHCIFLPPPSGPGASPLPPRSP